MKTKKLLIGLSLLGITFGGTMSLNATNYFVKADGNGTAGLTWDDAISGEIFTTKVKNNEFSTGDIIYFSGGTYKLSSSPTDTLVITKGITLVGGFDPSSTGNQATATYQTDFETIFSGDLNSDGVASDGDAYRILTINSTDKVTLKNLTFKNAYYAGANGNDPGAIYARNTTLDIQNCKIIDNKSGFYGGGGGLSLISSTVYCYQSTLKGNSAPSRGGAIRVSGSSTDIPGILILDQCLLTGNSTETNYGGAIQLSSTGTGLTYVNKVYVINSTITDNFCGEKGGGAISISKGEAAFIISSTLANNISVDKSQGNSIRLDTKAGAYIYMVNSICVENATETETSIGVNAGTAISGGGNYVGGTITTSDTPWMENDATNKTYSDVFGSNELANNGGPTQTIIPVIPGIMSASDLSTTATRWLNSGDITADFTKDQRGYARSNGTVAIGAYDKNSISGFAQLKESGIDVYPTRTTGIVTVSGAAGKTIRLLNLQGSVIKVVKCVNNAEIMDLSSFAKGIYLLSVDSGTIKVVLQ